MFKCGGGSWYSDLSWGVGVCALPHVLGWRSQKIAALPLRIISGTTLTLLFFASNLRYSIAEHPCVRFFRLKMVPIDRPYTTLYWSAIIKLL